MRNTHQREFRTGMTNVRTRCLFSPSHVLHDDVVLYLQKLISHHYIQSIGVESGGSSSLTRYRCEISCTTTGVNFRWYNFLYNDIF